MARLSMGPRLAVLGVFNAGVYVVYLGIIERSKKRGGSFEQDGYEFWNMWLPPKHSREHLQPHPSDNPSMDPVKQE